MGKICLLKLLYCNVPGIDTKVHFFCVHALTNQQEAEPYGKP